MKEKIQYIIFGIFVLSICILLFSNSDSKDKTYIFNTVGNKIDIKQINFSPEKSYLKDSTVQRGTLDGDQTVPSPKISEKPFDPNAPFTKLTFRMLRTYIPGKTLPEDIKNLNENNVEILGFMTPLNALENMDEFLLCSAPPLSCYCAPPIFINEIIYVRLISKRTDFKTGAVKVKGQFHVNTDVKDEYSDIIYTINASDID
jgi:hypothetical protein